MNEFTIRISGKQAGEEVSPTHAPLKEVKEIFDALYALIRQTTGENEPSVVSFKAGSLMVVAHPPLSTLTHLDEVIREGHPQSDQPYTRFVEQLEKVSRNSGLDMALLRDDVVVASITPKEGASLRPREPLWVRTTLTLSGLIMNMGGKNPNIHVLEDHTFETRIIAIDGQTVQDLRLYKLRYIFDVEAEQALEDPSKLRNFKYRSHLAIPQKMSLQDFIAAESPKWSDVDNAEDWVSVMRGRLDPN